MVTNGYPTLIKYEDGIIEIRARADLLRAEIDAAIAEDGNVSMSVDSTIVDMLAEILETLGYEVTFPGQDEVQDGVTYTAIHVEKR